MRFVLLTINVELQNSQNIFTSIVNHAVNVKLKQRSTFEMEMYGNDFVLDSLRS